MKDFVNECNFLPIYKIGIDEIMDGTLIKCPNFCKTKKNIKCLQFYKKIFAEKAGIYVCPYGFNVCIYREDERCEIFTCLRIKGEYLKNLVNPKINDFDNNRVISEAEMSAYIKAYISYEKRIDDLKFLESFMEEMVHDLRKFNALIKNNSNTIQYNINSKTKVEAAGHAIWAMSSYISTRLDAYSFLYDRDRLVTGGMTTYNFYRIFDKIKKCFKASFDEKGLHFNLYSNGLVPDIKAYDCIEMIPFLLTDNALKYSLTGTNVEVQISDSVDKQIVEMESIGPLLGKNESDKIFLRGIRGENAKKLRGNEGSGIGLYILKQICDHHDIDVNVFLDDNVYKKFNGVEYSKFKIRFDILKTGKCGDRYD